ncbi:glutaredoxin family protein [Oceanobacillus piezotolerans]|uniref:glutaredoxin family protein n=1 Tax=Oceanobacillus piezotolerans TaxID=2448030 RepID=UPI001FEA9B1D|nr:glutaredoxin family protein [Oceanobacillus piezotolerans]
MLFYTKENCGLCNDANTLLELLREEFTFKTEYRDIYTNDVWLEKYQLTIPVIEVNGKQLNAVEINYESLHDLLEKESTREAN